MRLPLPYAMPIRTGQQGGYSFDLIRGYAVHIAATTFALRQVKLSEDSEVYYVSEVSPNGEVANLTSLLH